MPSIDNLLFRMHWALGNRPFDVRVTSVNDYKWSRVTTDKQGNKIDTLSVEDIYGWSPVDEDAPDIEIIEFYVGLSGTIQQLNKDSKPLGEMHTFVLNEMGEVLYPVEQFQQNLEILKLNKESNIYNTYRIWIKEKDLQRGNHHTLEMQFFERMPKEIFGESICDNVAFSMPNYSHVTGFTLVAKQ